MRRRISTKYKPALLGGLTGVITTLSLVIAIAAIAAPTQSPPNGNPQFPLQGETGPQGQTGAAGPQGQTGSQGPKGDPGILDTALLTVECNGDCSTTTAPNTVCSAQYGANWKALSVGCECVEDPAGVTGVRKRSFDQSPDYCCETPGEDLTISCYRSQ